MSEEYEEEDFDLVEDELSDTEREGEESEVDIEESEESELDDIMEEPLLEEGEGKTNINDTDEDTDEEMEEKINVFDNSVKIHLLDQHNELKHSNYKEIQSLSNVIRDKDNNIIDELHRTIPFITRYEKARILGERAKQLSFPNIQPMIEVPSDVIDNYEIAKLEYEANKIPFIIKRTLPNGSCEYWKFQDLEKILFN